MFDHYLRQLKDRLFLPIAQQLGRWIHPNVISLLALIVGLVAAVLAARGAAFAAFVAWILNRTLDGLDGSVARAGHSQSDFGGYLDVILDFVVYAAVPLGIVVGAPTLGAWRAVAFLLASFYINAASWMYLASLLEGRNAGAHARAELTSVHMPPGLIAGTETVILYSLFLLFPDYAAHLFVLMGGLALVNVGYRLIWAWRRL
ncbi:MAG: CDP-alcohol phosphatidyltransferase family protein [Gemmatimonadetes bacterium]|nr:CDP-alcohol phosphatidyltransferase family protein [Gemmatimonadota bacterium]